MEVGCEEGFGAGDGDLEVRRERRVDVPLHDVGMRVEPHHPDDAVVESVVMGERIAADEDEVLVARVAGALVGVDGAEIDLVVLAVLEVGDRVAVRSLGAVHHGAENEGVAPGSAGQDVLAFAADEQVVALAAAQIVVAGAADEGVVAGAATRTSLPRMP